MGEKCVVAVVVIWGKDYKHKGAIEEQVCGLWVYLFQVKCCNPKNCEKCWE